MADFEPWLKFRCNSCRWETLGTYNFGDNPDWEGALPDTDCPKCGSHDSVVDVEDNLPTPSVEAIVALIRDINSGPYARGYRGEDGKLLPE